MKCRMCASPSLEKIFEVDDCPKYSHKYFTQEALKNDAKIRLEVFICRQCSLMQIAQDFPGEEYTDDYQRNISFSPAAVAHIDRFAQILRSYGAKNFLEVGCGNGIFSKRMKELGAKVSAIEPSVAACRAARENGIEAHNIFLGDDTPPEFGGYDSFALRFVLEHVPDPVKILKQINSRCAGGAVGLVEVPNAENQVREKKWFEFFREHTVYFTPKTFLEALYRSGFQMVEMHTTMGGEFISAIVKKAKPDFDWKKEEFCKKLRGLVQGGKKTAVWGASGAGITLLCEAGLGEKEIMCIIDSDKNKWGLYASGSRIKIVPPKSIGEDAPDAIIICSSAYEAEIKAAILKSGFKGKIGSIFPSPRWISD
ncbi:MAG: methyltransferase domain-containing protein [Candidatus Micrarchaeota archaeon]